MLLKLLLVTLATVNAKRLPEIFWNSTNSLVERYAAIGDTLDIICPYFDETDPKEMTEQSIIYRVSEDEYESCEKRSTAKELGRCTSPYKQDKIKVAFRLMSPNPSGLDYRPGTTYFFISTSTGAENGLNNERGGLCASHNLKMVIHVTEKNGDIGNRHRHHHHHKKVEAPQPTVKPAKTTAPSALSDSFGDNLWEQFYEKIGPQNQWPEPSRAERVTLYAGNKKDEYQSAPVPEIIDFEIHEIGEVESLYSSSRSWTIWTLVVVAVLSCLI